MLRKVDPSSTFQLATLKFVAWKVEHAVVIRATTSFTCSATMLRDKLNENVARITWPLIFFSIPDHPCSNLVYSYLFGVYLP